MTREQNRKPFGKIFNRHVSFGKMNILLKIDHNIGIQQLENVYMNGINMYLLSCRTFSDSTRKSCRSEGIFCRKCDDRDR